RQPVGLALQTRRPPAPPAARSSCDLLESPPSLASQRGNVNASVLPRPSRASPGRHPRPPRPWGSTLVAVKGDRVEVLVDVGGGVRQFDVLATKAGRRVEVSSARGVMEVTEVTRSGQPVRTARFMSARVVSVVEHPAADN